MVIYRPGILYPHLHVDGEIQLRHVGFEHVDGEHDICGRVQHPIRPLHTLTEVNGYFGEVVVVLVSRGQPRDDVVCVCEGVVEIQRFVDEDVQKVVVAGHVQVYGGIVRVFPTADHDRAIARYGREFVSPFTRFFY